MLAPTSRVVARTREAIVFTKGRGIGDNDAVRTYGCYLRKGNTYRLNEPGEFGPTRIERPLSLAGRFVACVQADASAAGGDFMEVHVESS